MIRLLRQGDWLNATRVTAYARILLTFELGLFVIGFAGSHGLIVSLSHPVTSDFVSFYAAGLQANSASPWLVYSRAAHFAAEQAAIAPGVDYIHFYYPPIYLLICGLLAKLPFCAAFFVFQAITLLGCLLAARAILPRVPISVLLAFPAVFWTMCTGQNAFLSAALFAAAILNLDRRPILSGVLFGALCYKPDLGLLIPIALIAGKHWRTFAAAAVTVSTLVLISGVVFGWPAWHAFLMAAQGSGAIYGKTGAVDVAGFTSPFGMLLTFGAAPMVAGAVQSVVMASAAVLVWAVWRRTADIALRGSILLTATLVAVPMLMFYDLMMLGIAMAWIVHRGLRDGFGCWEKLPLAVLFFLPLLSGNLNRHTPVASILALFGILLTGAIARRCLAAPGYMLRGRLASGNAVVQIRDAWLHEH